MERTVYRKQSKSNSIISFDFNSPFSHKFSAYKIYVNRAFDACTDKYLEKEISTIKQIAIENDFPPQYISSLVNEVKQPRQKIELSLSNFLLHV